jgi:hypothetical protein
MKREEFAPVEHIVQALQEKTRRLVELAPEIWKVTCSEDNEISARWRLLIVCHFFVGSWDSSYTIKYIYIVLYSSGQVEAMSIYNQRSNPFAIPWMNRQIVAILMIKNIIVIARSRRWIMQLSILWKKMFG